ncbi:MAG: HD domain-containing protein [Isosphaerales bacterium]
MASKIIRDPLYNYVSIERKKDGWLLDVLNSPEIQRLRRIHQLGVSYLTFPGADHNRLVHSLGVLHLMTQVMEHLDSNYEDAQVRRAREPLLAAALTHDVGHGPFSHLFEPCLGVDHEQWSKKIIESTDTTLHKALRACDQSLPRTVAELVDPEDHNHPSWQKYLLSSQLDMDRLDYLRRDSLFTGSDYGHFDWYRLINSLELFGDEQTGRDIVWPEKACLAIEEFIFSRYYMYHNVYLHKTTRGFEKLLEAMWARAKGFFAEGRDTLLVPAIRDFWSATEPSVSQYLAIEEFTVLQQIQNWTSHEDKALSDLARRFLDRDRLAMIEPPDFEGDLTPDYQGWGVELNRLVASRVEYDPPEMYCLVDRVKAKYNQPYFPEKEDDEQSVNNAIRVRVEGESKPIEISQRLTRLKPVTEAPAEKVRYYIPKALQKDAERLRSQWK